jgi:predicted Zn-dependent peptidase
MGVVVSVASVDNDLLISYKGSQEMIKGSLMLFNDFFLQSNFSQQTYYYAVHELVEKYGALQISASELAANLAQNTFKSRQMYKDEADKDDFAFIKENSEFIKRNFDLIFCPERAIVSISGAVDTNDLEPVIEPFRIWLQPEKREKKPALFDSGDSLDFENPGIYVLDTKKDKEARIVSTWYDIPFQDEFRSTISAEILNHTMGEKHNSILDQNLGAIKGFHDWESQLQILNKNSMFQIEAGIEQPANEAITQLDQLFAGIDYKDIKRRDYKKMQRAFLNTKILHYESAEQKADLMYSIVRYNWETDYFKALKKAVKKTKRKSLNAFMNSFLIDGSHFYLLSGDMDAIMNALPADMRKNIIEIDKFGRLKIE